MQESPTQFIWKLGKKSRKDVCRSENIYLCGNKYEFYFQLFKIRNGFHLLHLLNPQLVFVNLDMEIKVKCKKTTSYCKLENSEIQCFDNFIFYNWSTEEEISEIIFTFLSVRDLPAYEIGKYNTTNPTGNIVEKSPSVFTWKLGNTQNTQKSYCRLCERIYICEKKWEFYFRLLMIREDFYVLYLLNPKIVFLKLDMDIIVKFCDTTTGHTMESYEIISFDQFLLGISHAKEISEITFSFKNAQYLKKPSCEKSKFIYKLSNTLETQGKFSPSTFTWKFNSGRKKDVTTSEIIRVCGNKYEFYFRLFKIREDFYKLHLLNPEIASVKLDMNIEVQFSDMLTDHTLENWEVKSFDQFLLAISHAKKISEITFMFLNVRDLKKPSYETDLTILSGNLKNAFLNKEDSDVIFRVGDQTYPAHKVIIKNRSSVFRAMLEHDMSEKNEGIINIEDGDPHIFRDFLHYLYTGKLEAISKENVFDLYYMCDKYDVDQLKLHCLEYIVNDLSIDIICYVIVLATKHSERDLLAHAVEFFMENAEEIFLTVQWQKFLTENPIPANELIIKAFKSDSRKLKSPDENKTKLK